MILLAPNPLQFLPFSLCFDRIVTLATATSASDFCIVVAANLVVIKADLVVIVIVVAATALRLSQNRRNPTQNRITGSTLPLIQFWFGKTLKPKDWSSRWFQHSDV